MQKLVCPGCKALFPETKDPSHAYIGASAGCWKVYGEVLAKEFSVYRYPDFHRLTVDAYCAQHPGESTPQSIQSVGMHLIALYLAFEMRMLLKGITPLLGRFLKKDVPFEWLKPPNHLGEVTVWDVAKTVSYAEHEQEVHRWAQEVWKAWESHHSTIKIWYEALAIPKVSDVRL